MSTAEEWMSAGGLPADGLSMPHAGSVLRQRRSDAVNPYSGQPVRGGEWGPEVVIDEAYVTGAPSTLTVTDGRRQQTAQPTLVCPYEADVAQGDRILVDGHTYEVEVHPARTTNPFTGWRPPQEVPLREVTG